MSGENQKDPQDEIKAAVEKRVEEETEQRKADKKEPENPPAPGGSVSAG